MCSLSLSLSLCLSLTLSLPFCPAPTCCIHTPRERDGERRNYSKHLWLCGCEMWRPCVRIWTPVTTVDTRQPISGCKNTGARRCTQREKTPSLVMTMHAYVCVCVWVCAQVWLRGCVTKTVNFVAHCKFPCRCGPFFSYGIHIKVPAKWISGLFPLHRNANNHPEGTERLFVSRERLEVWRKSNNKFWVHSTCQCGACAHRWSSSLRRCPCVCSAGRAEGRGSAWRSCLCPGSPKMCPRTGTDLDQVQRQTLSTFLDMKSQIMSTIVKTRHQTDHLAFSNFSGFPQRAHFTNPHRPRNISRNKHMKER